MKKNYLIFLAIAVLGFFAFTAFRSKDTGVPAIDDEAEPTKDEIIRYVVGFMQGKKTVFKPSTVLGLIEVESSFDVNARGSIGEYGLTQVTDGAVSDVRQFTDFGTLVDGYPSDWKSNVNAGIGYLVRNHNTLKDVDRAVRAYNIGITAEMRNENQAAGNAYLKRVKDAAAKYKQYD